MLLFAPKSNQKFCMLFFVQTRLEVRSVASWCTALPVSAALSRWPWPTWCRSSTCPWTTPTTSSRWKNQTSRPTLTSWASCWTLSAHWDFRARATTGPRRRRSRCTSARPPITTSSSSTRSSPRETPGAPAKGAWPSQCGFLSFSSLKQRRVFRTIFDAAGVRCRLSWVSRWRANALWPEAERQLLYYWDGETQLCISLRLCKVVPAFYLRTQACEDCPNEELLACQRDWNWTVLKNKTKKQLETCSVSVCFF